MRDRSDRNAAWSSGRENCWIEGAYMNASACRDCPCAGQSINDCLRTVRRHQGSGPCQDWRSRNTKSPVADGESTTGPESKLCAYSPDSATFWALIKARRLNRRAGRKAIALIDEMAPRIDHPESITIEDLQP